MYLHRGGKNKGYRTSTKASPRAVDNTRPTSPSKNSTLKSHPDNQGLLKSITTRPAISPLLSCCTLSGISLNPLTSQICFNNPRCAYSNAWAVSCIVPTREPMILRLRKAKCEGSPPTVTVSLGAGRGQPEIKTNKKQCTRDMIGEGLEDLRSATHIITPPMRSPI